MSAFGQYIPSENEDILHRRFNIYCNCLRRYTASANEVYLHFQRSRIGKLWTFILFFPHGNGFDTGAWFKYNCKDCKCKFSPTSRHDATISSTKRIYMHKPFQLSADMKEYIAAHSGTLA